MTWWSLRRRHGVPQDAERENRSASVAQSPTAPSPADQSAADQGLDSEPESGSLSSWFDPRWSRQGQPQAGAHGAGRPGGRRAGTGAVPAPRASADAGTETQPGNVWSGICDQFGLQLLVLAEQLRSSLDELEADEDDSERLRRLFQVDHAVTRMRRASRDMRILADRSEEELAGFTTSLLDVIRMAASGIERYTQVAIGRVTDLAVLGYAADDIGSAMAALLDNATRYSPGTVTVSANLTEDGGVMFRIEDSGIGIGPEQIAVLNATFAGPVPDVDERTGRHTGFPVVHRIAHKHVLGVWLAARTLTGNGTIAVLTVPPRLLCEIPANEAQRQPAAATPAAARPSPLPDLPQVGPQTQPSQLPQWAPPEPSDPGDGQGADTGSERAAGGLPRRQRASLRGQRPRPPAQPAGMVPTAEQQAAARRAFASDLTAFSLGASGRSAAANADADHGTEIATTATEDEAQS